MKKVRAWRALASSSDVCFLIDVSHERVQDKEGTVPTESFLSLFFFPFPSSSLALSSGNRRKHRCSRQFLREAEAAAVPAFRAAGLVEATAASCGSTRRRSRYVFSFSSFSLSLSAAATGPWQKKGGGRREGREFLSTLGLRRKRNFGRGSALTPLALSLSSAV
jgi:hypothetical protein